MKLFDEMRIAYIKKNVNEMAIFFKKISYMHKKWKKILYIVSMRNYIQKIIKSLNYSAAASLRIGSAVR